MLATVMPPVTAPEAVGANFKVKLVDWPAAREMGRAREVVLKPAPVMLAWVIESAAVPLLVS